MFVVFSQVMPTSDLVEIKEAMQAITGKKKTKEHFPMGDTGAA